MNTMEILKKLGVTVLIVCLTVTSLFIEYNDFPLFAAQDEATPSEGDAWQNPSQGGNPDSSQQNPTEESEKTETYETTEIIEMNSEHSIEADSEYSTETDSEYFTETDSEYSTETDSKSDLEEYARPRNMSDIITDIIIKKEEQNTTPTCSVISEDTTWTSGTLTNGTLTVLEGVTLTLTGSVSISGNVTIEGGGTILRGSQNAAISAQSDTTLSLGNITIDGNSLASSVAMITLNSNNNVTLDHGCTIQNCGMPSTTSNTKGGAINLAASSQNIHLTVNHATIRNCFAFTGGGINSSSSANSTVTINENALFEDCSSALFGGAISMEYQYSFLIINGGTFRHNRTLLANAGIEGGGAIFICQSTLTVNGGKFIENTTPGKGGAIHHCGHKDTKTYIYGGYFENNTCTNPNYLGSGGIYNSTQAQENTDMTISGSVQFCGDNISDSGTDGVYLDQSGTTPRKIWISDTLSYPITIYVKPIEGYVIAEGVDGYVLLKNRDMKKITFINASDLETPWYPVLDKTTNQIKLSTENPEYKYFVYYISNGLKGLVEDNNNNDEGYEEGDEITVKSADGLILPENYTFLGWNEEPDGSGVMYQTDDKITVTKDINLYAAFAVDLIKYTVEHYQQNVTGDGYILADSETKTGKNNEIVEAIAKDYPGFIENDSHIERVSSGNLQENGNLVLKLFYDRDLYKIDFDLNGADGAVLASQTVPYGGFLQTANDPMRRGYNFKGWYTDQEGTPQNQWDFGKPVEQNTSSHSVTLYAKWADEIAPVLREASYNEGYKNLLHWIIRKKDLIVTIPIVEEGSGIKQVEYILTPEEGMEAAKTIRADGNVPHDESNAVSPNGGNGTGKTGLAQIEEADGQTIAKVTIDEDFKGKLGLMCQDHAGNITASVISASENGMIVEDNAPEIHFSPLNDDSSNESTTTTIHVTVEDTDGSKVTCGIAGISYQTDNGDTISVTETAFNSDIVTICDFSVDISGVGEHVLNVTAVDNAGNENSAMIQVTIKALIKPYQVEHYIQDISGDDYTLFETEAFAGEVGNLVTANTKNYAGFTENISHEERNASAIIPEENLLILKLYYDRNVYEINFDLNEGEGSSPSPQTIRYGGFLQNVNEPVRKGYHFKGWYMDQEGTDASLWKEDQTVEQNTSSESVTLYAKWADETPPVLEEVSYNTGYKMIFNWIIRKKDLIITVPIIEEGSGVREAEYYFLSAKDITTVSTVKQASSESLRKSEEPTNKMARIETENGQTVAKIIIDKDFIGSIFMNCTDNAGNVSAGKSLMAFENGVIVEDNAPIISFSSEDGDLSDLFYKKIAIDVTVEDAISKDGYEMISGGIADVSYRLDNQDAVTLTGFENNLVEYRDFTVEISGIGKHTLTINAVDHAGNESTAQIEVEIGIQSYITKTPDPTYDVRWHGHTATPTSAPETTQITEPQRNGEPQKSGEPQTGDSLHIQLYATMSMIAGFSYLLLYFFTKCKTMEERDFKQTLSCLAHWGKTGGTIRKILAYTAIFFLMIGYYSLGKLTSVSWKKVYDN